MLSRPSSPSSARSDWDVAMAKHTGCEHYIFDPTAPCHEPNKEKDSCKPWAHLLGPKLVAERNITAYEPYGISGHNGYLRWFNRAVPVYTLATIMARLGHTGRRIDVLKLDIEGSEFDVVPNLVKSGIEIGKIHCKPNKTGSRWIKYPDLARPYSAELTIKDYLDLWCFAECKQAETISSDA